MQPQGIERRRAPRAAVNFQIQLATKALPTKADSAPATLKDISSNGLACTFHEPLNEMTMVRLDVKFPKDQDMHRIEGVVVRCDKRRGISPPSYEIAIYFAEMSEAGRKSLERFVAQAIAQLPPQRATK